MLFINILSDSVVNVTVSERVYAEDPFDKGRNTAGTEPQIQEISLSKIEAVKIEAVR